MRGKLWTMQSAEFERQLKLLTPDEAKRLLRDLERQIKWDIWQRKHPILAGILEGLYTVGVLMSQPLLPRL